MWARGTQGKSVSGEEGKGPSRPQRSLRGVKVYVTPDVYLEMTLAVQYGTVTGKGPRTYNQLLLEGFEYWKQHHPEVEEYIKANKPILEKAMKGQGGQGGEKV
jgi:hypothetical protein